MGDEDEGAAERLERFEQDICRVDVQMVRRLVQNQRVRRPQEHARHREARPLAPGEDAYRLVDVVFRKEEAAQDVPDRGHHVHRRSGGERLVDGERRVEPGRFVLREVLRVDPVADGPLAAVGRLRPREHPHEGRLAGAVWTDQGEAVAALDMKIHAAEHANVAVGLRGVAQLDYRASAPRARGKGEVHLLPFGRHFDWCDLLQHLDPALDLLRLGRLVAKAVDEELYPGDVLVLLLLRGPEPGDPRVAIRQVGAVGARIRVKGTEIDVGDGGDDGIEEVAVVRHEDHRVRVLDQELLQPVPRLEVEVVRRLVEEQQPRPGEQELGERDAHLPAAREVLGRAVEVLRRKAEAAQHGVHLRLDTVTVAMRERFLRLRVAMEQLVVRVAGYRGVRKLPFQVLHFGLERQQRREGERRLVPERPSRVGQSVLRQVADRQAGRAYDLSGVQLHLTGQHPEQRRLSGAVRAAEADALTWLHLPGDAVEQHAVRERLVKARYLYHAGSTRPVR